VYGRYGFSRDLGTNMYEKRYRINEKRQNQTTPLPPNEYYARKKKFDFGVFGGLVDFTTRHSKYLRKPSAVTIVRYV